MLLPLSASPCRKVRRVRCRLTLEAKRAPHTPSRNATQTSESSTIEAPSDTLQAGKSQPGSRPQLLAKRESTPTRLSTRLNRRARLDTAIPPDQFRHPNRRALAQNMSGKRAPLPTVNHRARKRTGRSAGSKPETPCPDEKNRSPGPKEPPLHWRSGEQLARDVSAAASRSRGRSATQCSFQLQLYPLRNLGKGQLQAIPL